MRRPEQRPRMLAARDGDQVTTPLRSVRVPEDLWQAATIVANRNGETISDVVREALREYVGSEK
jgi:hypothetical protein